MNGAEAVARILQREGVEYLFAYPAWRRDRRVLAGCLLGLLAGLVVVPVAALGPKQTAEQYHRYSAVLFAPLVKSRALTAVPAGPVSVQLKLKLLVRESK